MPEPSSAAPVPPPPRRLAFFKRTLPLLLLVAGGAWFFHDSPRDVTLAMDLAGRREGLKALRVDLYRLPGRERARHLELFYTAARPPAPALRAVVRVSPAEYEAVLAFDYGHRTETVERRFTLDGRQEEVVLPP